MTTEDFISELFYQIDETMSAIPKHAQASLWPREVVTLGVLFALKGVSTRACYRWLSRDWRPLFPALPERTRLLRLFAAHRQWTDAFLAAPSVWGVVDSYGIELLHPIREGRSPQQIGRKGKSHHRWIVGGKLCLVLNQVGLGVAWDCAGAKAPDTAFHPLLEAFDQQMMVLSDTGFPAQEGDPPNRKLCARGTWNTRLLVETVLSMLTGVCHLKKVLHRHWAYFQARLAFTLAAFNILVQWERVRERGRVASVRRAGATRHPLPNPLPARERGKMGISALGSESVVSSTPRGREEERGKRDGLMLDSKSRVRSAHQYAGPHPGAQAHPTDLPEFCYAPGEGRSGVRGLLVSCRGGCVP